jgi:hypothetical protein
MALCLRRQAGANIAASCFDAIVIALLRDWAELWWRWRDNDHGLRVGTSKQRHGEQQCGQRYDLSHRHWGDLVG